LTQGKVALGQKKRVLCPGNPGNQVSRGLTGGSNK
jgi:hypothetical protein